jgi:acyl-CoA synthetase (AMP-forming)/AMP-acid ligase II
MNSLLEEHADRVAIVAGDRSMTYARLADRAGMIAGGLAQMGFRRGDVLALWLPNVPEWLEVLFACARLGVCVAAVNTRYRSAELEYILGMSRARGVVLAPGFLDVDWMAILDDARPKLPDLEFVLAPRDLPMGPHRADEGRREDLLALFATSGTTSAPKLAGHKQGAVDRHAREVARAFDVRGGESCLLALPLCGVFGFNTALGALAAGATCLLQEVFDADEAARLMVRHGVEHLNGSDAMLKAILASPELDPERLRWRRGGFAEFTNLGGEVVAEADRRGVAVTGVFGMSEVFALMATWDPEDPTELRARAGGRPICADIEVRACDPESGEVRPDEEPGELQVRGYNVIQRYLHNEPATAAAFTDDGWFRTGDLGYTRAEGGFVFLSRLGDSLRLRGFLVDPAEIEEQLLAEPSVEAAQVVGADIPGQGEVPVAFVIAGQGFDVERVLAALRGRIAAYKVPRQILEVTEFPTTPGPNGTKVQKARLRELAAEALNREG